MSGISDNAGQKSFWAASGPIFFLTGIFLVNFISRIGFGPLMPTIEEDLGLSHAQAGSLFLWLSLGYFLSVFSSGFVSARLSHKRTILVSSLGLGAVLLITQFAGGLAALSLCMFAMGLAAGLYLPSGIASITTLVEERHWGKALAIHELAPNLGFVCAPLLAEALIGSMGWQGMLGILGTASLVMGLAFVRWGKGGDFRGQPPNPANVKVLIAEPSFWILMLLFSLGIGASVGVFAMLPLYLVSDHGIERSTANLLVAASRVASVFSAFAAGWAADRMGYRLTLVIVFAASGSLTVLMGMAEGNLLWLAIFLQPTLTVCFFPAGFAALARLSPPEMRGLVVSLCVPLGFVVGGGGFPLAIGWLGETLSFSWGMAAAGMLIFCGVGLLPWLKSGGQST